MAFKYSLHSSSPAIQTLISRRRDIKYFQQSFLKVLLWIQGSNLRTFVEKKKDLLHKVLLIISSQLTFSTSSMLEMLAEPFAGGKHALAAAMRVTYKTRVGLGFQHWKSCSIPNSEFYTPLIIIIQSSFIYTLKWKQALLVSVHKVLVAIRPVSRIQF